MSIEAIAWALRVPVGGGPKVTLIGLASHARAEFDEARPSVETLMAYGYCDRRTVQRHLRTLEEAGWIEATGNHATGGHGGRVVTVYQLRGGILPPQEDRGAAKLTSRGGATVAVGAALAPPNTSIETSLPPTEVEPSSVRASSRPWKYRGKTVPANLRLVALEALDAFNAAAGFVLPAFGGAGQVTDHLKTITGAVLDFPTMTGDDWRRVVDRNFATPWWDDVPGVGVIFGPAVRHRAVANDGTRPVARSKAQVREDEQLAMLRRLHVEARAKESAK